MFFQHNKVAKAYNECRRGEYFILRPIIGRFGWTEKTGKYIVSLILDHKIAVFYVYKDQMYSMLLDIPDLEDIRDTELFFKKL